MPSYSVYSAFTKLALALSALWQREVVNTAAVARLFNEQASTDAVERTKGLGAMGLVPKYNGKLEYRTVDPLDLATYTHVEYGDAINIPRALIDDESYGVIKRLVREHAMSYTRTLAHYQASVFNNAFSASFLGPDGKSLCATNHSSGTKPSFNNKGTSALTHDNVVTTRQIMRKWKDEAGNVMLVKPDLLVVPVELEAKADEIVNSVQRSDNANNATNTNRNLTYVVEPLLTDANNWFLTDSLLAGMYLNWFWRVRPEYAEDPTGNYNLGMNMRGYMRFSFGWDTHTWIYGHEVA